MPKRRRVLDRSWGFPILRRSGAVTELLFLYDCTTHEVPQLRPVAHRLGLTVQAVSHVFRGLARRGLAEIREGRYRPTVSGVAWLQSTLGSVRDDLVERIGRLHIVRTTRAVALDPITAGAAVSLELRDGILTARHRKGGSSRGRARASARPGQLIEIGDLEGILPLSRGRVRLVVLGSDQLSAVGLLGRIRAAANARSKGLLAAQGLEAYHLLRRAVPRSTAARFGVAAACAEASRLGVDSTVFLTDNEVPRFLEQFVGPDPPAMEFLSVGDSRFRREPAGRRPRRGSS